MDVQNTSHFVENFCLKTPWILKLLLNAWEDKSFSRLICKLKTGNLDLVVPEDFFSIGSTCAQYKHKCVQRPSFQFDSG